MKDSDIFYFWHYIDAAGLPRISCSQAVTGKKRGTTLLHEMKMFGMVVRLSFKIPCYLLLIYFECHFIPVYLDKGHTFALGTHYCIVLDSGVLNNLYPYR